MVVMLVVFLILMALVKKFAWGPVVDMMEKRERYVADEIDAAEKSRKEAREASAKRHRQTQETERGGQQIIGDGKPAGGQQEQGIIASAKQEAERVKEAADEEIQSEKDKALQALQDKVASLSVLIASKVIEKEISAQDQDKLIEEYIKEVGEER